MKRAGLTPWKDRQVLSVERPAPGEREAGTVHFSIIRINLLSKPGSKVSPPGGDLEGAGAFSIQYPN